jgi:hypothetical protein
MKYFKCTPDTNLYSQIQLLREKIKFAKDQIKSWAEVNGIKEWTYFKRHLVNRPSFVKFNEGVTPPDGWRFYKKEQAYAPDSRSKAGKSQSWANCSNLKIIKCLMITAVLVGTVIQLYTLGVQRMPLRIQ